MSYDPEFIIRMLVGNLGYVLLVVSMMMTRMVLLRVFAMAAVFQIALGLYRNRPAVISTDEQALQAALMLDFEPRHVRAIRSVGFWQDSEPGSELMRQGELAKNLIVLHSGNVSVLVDGQHVGSCGPGS